MLSNPGNNIDFTLAQLYRQIPICSGIARYNYSKEASWRTAFRECIKLLIEDSPLSKERLNVWQTGEGEFSDYSIYGAKDAIRYYNQNKSDTRKLFLSYEWAWLKDYFKSLYQ